MVGVMFVIVNSAGGKLVARVRTSDLELPLEIVQVGEQVREAVLGDVNFRGVELPVGPVDGLPDAPGCHLQPARTGHEPSLVLVTAVSDSHRNY